MSENYLRDARAKVDAAKAVADEIAGAPAPLPETEAQLSAYLDFLAQPWENVLRQLATECAYHASGDAIAPHYITENPRLALAGLIALNRGRIIEDVLTRAETMRASLPPAMAAEARAVALRKARADLHKAELAEAAVGYEMNAQPRVDANTAALLGLPFDVADTPEIVEIMRH